MNNNFSGYAGLAKLGQKLFTSPRLFLAGMALAGTLQAGSPLGRLDVIVADSQATIYAFSPQTGHRIIIAQGDKLDRPYDLARTSDGSIVVSDTGTLRIVRVNPLTGQQIVVAEGPALGVPYGLAVDSQNRIYVANSQAILSVSPGGNVETVSAGGLLQVPLDVTVGSDGKLYVADAVAGVVRIDPVTKQQSLLAQAGFLHTPTGITTDGNRTGYVVDGAGQCVVAVDLQTGAQRKVSGAGLLTTPVGIAISPTGTVVVSDPDAFNLDGGIMVIGQDGSQTPIAQGSGDLLNARGIAIVPAFVDGAKK